MRERARKTGNGIQVSVLLSEKGVGKLELNGLKIGIVVCPREN